MKTVLVVLIFFLIYHLATLQPASRSVRYTVVDLGNFSAEGINNKGWIVGSTKEAPGKVGYMVACMYKNGKVEPLSQPKEDPESYALFLNDQGIVVGNSRYRFLAGFNTTRPYLWKEGKAFSLKLLAGHNIGEANEINAHGQIAGSSGYYDIKFPNSLKSNAVLWEVDKIVDMGSLGGSISGATSINDAGEVVGSAELADGTSHAFLYANGKMRDLGTLGGRDSNATRLNARGQVIGDSYLGKGDTSHAFLWQDGKMQDLGTLPNRENSSAHSINNRGQIVGEAYTDVMKPHAFLWQNGSMVDLNTLIPANSGWVLEIPAAIDNQGQILGNGMYHGVRHAFLLKPIAL